MMQHHLFWHVATYNQQGSFPPPPHHQLVGAAGLEVLKRDPPKMKAWACLRENPADVLARLDASVANAHVVTTFAGKHFGMPVVMSNALIANVPVPNLIKIDDVIGHVDVAQELREMTNPTSTMGFDMMCHLCGLPPRPELDVIKTWEDRDRRKRIGKRLLIDVAFIALGYARLQYVTNVWTADQTQVFHDLVIKTVRAKVPALAKMWAA